MSREFYSLLHKEWTERRSMFKLGIVFVIGFLGYCVAYEIEYRTRTFIAGYYHTCLIFSQLGSVLLAMTVATGEYSQRTLKFSASLPISLSKVAWSRLLVAWGCLIGPILLATIIVTGILASGFFEQAGLRSELTSLPDRPNLSRLEAIGFLWTIFAVAVACALQLSSLLALIGTRCRNEATIGLLGVVVIMLMMMLTSFRATLESFGQFLVADWIGGLIPNSMLISWGYGDTDGSSYTDLELAPLVFGPLLLNLLLTLVLAYGFANGYGRRAESGRARTSHWRRWLPALPQLRTDWFNRWRSQNSALIWLNARQSIPLSLSGLLIAALFGLIGILEQPGTTITLGRLRGSLAENTWFVGLLWSAIVAIGVFGSELNPELEQFWRSRPIAPGRWFRIKFIVGLSAVIGALDLLPAIIAWNVPYNHTTGKMGFAYLACMPLLHAQIYSVTVAAICKVRRPIPAAMIGILLYMVTDAVMQSFPFRDNLSSVEVYNALNGAQHAGEKLDLTSAGYPIVYGSVLCIIVVATVLARRSIVSPRASSLSLLAVIAIGLFSPAQTQGDDRQTMDEIIAGSRAREASIKDYHIHFKLHRHRTEAFYRNATAYQPGSRRRQWPTAIRSSSPPEEELEYDLFERLPCCAWTTLGADGVVKSVTAIDGTIQRDYSVAANHHSRGTITASTQPARIPIPAPDSSLMFCGGTALMKLLEERNARDIVYRELDGEKLIDLTLSVQSNDDTRDASKVISDYRFYVTINASRNYWPIHVRGEFATSPDGIPFSIIDVKADGWIEAGSIVYPRRIEQTNYVSLSFAANQSKSSNSTATSQQPEQTETQAVEITELAINTGFSEDVFRPSFPPGALIWDMRDRKQYEADAAGILQSYVAKPKGVRGAVFGYHIIWISVATVWLFLRRAGTAAVNSHLR